MAVIPHEQVPALDASYRTIRVLAEGPGGLTELVRGPQGQVLVRKRIPQELANVHAWMTLTRVESPLLPHIDSLYELNGDLVVVLSYVDGITLEELVGSTGPLGANEAVRYLCELCEAVGVLHANGIVHRDLSPGNVVVAGGSARIIDLGNARVHSEGAPRDTTTLGTFGFAAPEQFGFAQTDARSDIYSLGSLLGYMLTGLRPDDPGFDLALADASRVPADLRLVVQRCREFEPSRRFQNAAELAGACGWTKTDSARLLASVSMQPTKVDNQKLFFDAAATSASRAGGVPNWKLKLAASWAFFLLWIYCFIDVGRGYWANGEIDLLAKLYYVPFCILGAVANVVMAIETQRALTLRGQYATAENVMKALRKRLTAIAAITFSLMVLLAIISSLLG